MGTGTDYVNTTRGPGDAVIDRRPAGADEDPDAIARDIEQTREEMTGTIGAIQERLEPERLSAEAKEVAHYVIEEAKGAVRELAGQASTAVHDATIGRVERMSATTREGAQTMGSDMFSTIKANPIPAALAAVGIGWMLMHRGESGQRSGSGSGAWASQATGYGSHYYDAYGASGAHQGQSTGQQAQQMTGQVASQVQERAGQVQQQLGNTAGQMQHMVGDTAGQVQQQAQGFWQSLQSNPVAAAALGLGLGAVAGMAIPETEKEHQLLGETRDSVIGSVKEMAGEKINQAQQIAQDVGSIAMEEAKAQGVMPSGSDSGSSSGSGSNSGSVSASRSSAPSSSGSGSGASASPS